MKGYTHWVEVESDLQLGLVLLAEFCDMILNGNRGHVAANAIMGFEADSEVLNDALASNDRHFIRRVKINDTQIEHAVRRCFRMVTEGSALHEIDVGEVKGDATEWLSYFLSTVPSEAMGAADFSSEIHGVDKPLPSLLSAAEARLELAEFVQNLAKFQDSHDLAQAGFSIKTIAALSGLDVRTVRNEAGPGGNRPLKTEGKGSTVTCHPLNSLEWLSGRRGFQVGYVGTDWMNEQFQFIKSRHAAYAIPGVVGWINKMPTKDIASRADLTEKDVRDWIYGFNDDSKNAAMIAEAVGLNSDAYESLIERLDS